MRFHQDLRIFLIIMSFAQERVRELQEDLNSLFQSLSSRFVNESVFRSSVSRVDLTGAQAFSTSDIERVGVLIKAIESIQLDKGNIPKLKVVLNQLDMVEKSLHENWKTT